MCVQSRTCTHTTMPVALGIHNDSSTLWVPQEPFTTGGVLQRGQERGRKKGMLMGRQEGGYGRTEEEIRKRIWQCRDGGKSGKAKKKKSEILEHRGKGMLFCSLLCIPGSERRSQRKSDKLKIKLSTVHLKIIFLKHLMERKKFNALPTRHFQSLGCLKAVLTIPKSSLANDLPS